MIYGLDLKAAAIYPRNALSVAKHIPIRGFHSTFGDFYEKVAKPWADKGGKFLGCDLLWDDNHNYGDKDIKGLERIVPLYDKLSVSYPETKIELVTFTEHNITKGVDKYHDIVKALAPKCEVVNNPWQGAFSKKFKNEVHGDKAYPNFGRFSYSVDGGYRDPTPQYPNDYAEIVDVDSQAIKDALEKTGRCDIFWLWVSRFNLRWRSRDLRSRLLRIKDPAKPTKKLISSVYFLSTERGPVKVASGVTGKSHAENHGPDKNGQPDRKGDKLLIIAPVKVPSLTLKRGQSVIATLPFFDIFDGGGYRYYWTKLAYEATEKGVPLTIWAGNKKLGTFNPGFRAGTFRGRKLSWVK